MMRDEKRIKQAEELEQLATELRKEAIRPLPDFWRVGQKVRYIRSEDWAFQKGGVACVKSLRPEYEGRPAHEYQVFYTGRSDCDEIYWTTPDDVELLEDV